INFPNKFRADSDGSCRGLLANRNHLHVKRDGCTLSSAKRTHAFQLVPSVGSGHCFFQKSKLNQRIMRKLDYPVMIRRRSVLEKRAVSVLANLFRLQKFRSHFDAYDLSFPIELVLLDVVEAINLVVDWRSERRRRDFFFGWGIIE